MSNSLQPHGMKHTRLPCPSTPRACSNSCPSCWWPSHPLSSPSPPAFNLSQHQGLFQWVSSSHQLAKVLDLQNQSFQWMNIQDWFLYDWLVGSPCSPRDCQESSPTPQFKSINSSTLIVLVTQLCLTLCNPMDYSSPGSSVHGILRARTLEWVAIPFSIQLSYARPMFNSFFAFSPVLGNKKGLKERLLFDLKMLRQIFYQQEMWYLLSSW